VSGLLNIAYPVLGTVDGWLAVLLPAWLRLAFWGALSGVVAMALYVALSSQGRLQALKARSAELRAAVARTEDAGEAARLALQNVKLSFRFLGAVLGPALLSGIPVLFVLAWISAAYSYALPVPGQAVPLTVEPPEAVVAVAPAAPGDRLAVAWPEAGGDVTLQEGANAPLVVPAEDLSLGIVHKRRWWNWLLGNEAGYLPDAGRADAVVLALPDREVLPLGPSWMRGWAFTYFVSLVVASLVVKFAFRIV
jgi:hypothetical protein